MAVHQQSLGIPKRRQLWPDASGAKVKYDVLDLKYPSTNTPAVLRHVDGSGFAYYASGRKAICLAASGLSHSKEHGMQARRFSAVLHDDAPRSPVIGVFDEWGRGYADCSRNPGDIMQPKVMVSDRVITKLEGNGKSTDYPTRPKGGSMLGVTGSDMSARLNSNITLNHKDGRISLDFSCEGVNHNFVLGELFGEEVGGMTKPLERTLSAEVTRKLDDIHSKAKPTIDMYGSFKIEPWQKDRKCVPKVDPKSSLSELLEQLGTLKSSMTSHTQLAPLDLEWNTELGLKKSLAKHHPQCPGQTKKNWSIARVGGKCTMERLMNTKPTVETPKTVPLISQLKLNSLIDEMSTRGALLVVICIATYAKEQSGYALSFAEKTQTELAQRLGSSFEDSVRIVAIELSEISGFMDQYNFRDVLPGEHAPSCLMFRGGHLVPGYPKRLAGLRIPLGSAFLARPQVLLVEPDPGNQFKLERALRRCGYSSDLAYGKDDFSEGPSLAQTAAHASRLASRQQVYGVLMISLGFRTDVIRGIISSVKRNEPKAFIVGFNGGLPVDEDQELRKRLFEECDHVCACIPSYTVLQTVLSKCQVGHPIFGKGCAHKKEFCDEIVNILQDGRGVKSTTLLPSQVPST